MWTGAPLRSARTAAGGVWLVCADEPHREQVPEALQVSEPATLPMVRLSRSTVFMDT